jgi:hypothetical protein
MPLRPLGPGTYRSREGDVLRWLAHVPTEKGELQYRPAGEITFYDVEPLEYRSNPLGEFLSFADPVTGQTREVRRPNFLELGIDGRFYEPVTLLAINCGDPLIRESHQKLQSIVGPFVEVRPAFDGECLYYKSFEILESLPQGEASENSPAMREAMDAVVAEIPLTAEQWVTCDILVLLASNWNTAGIEIRQIATLRAFERRKRDVIRWMVFGNDMLTDDAPMSSREEDIREILE